jgi:hypothetical protein
MSEVRCPDAEMLPVSHTPSTSLFILLLVETAYPKMVPKTVESDVYRREHLKRGVQRIWVRMKVGFPILKLQFYVEHHYDPSQRSMTWTLDYSRRSDLDDSVGFWYVVPHPDRPRDASRVYYSVDVSLFSWVPHFVVEFMSQQALVDATAWVKKYSELAQQSATRKEAGTGTGAGTGAGAGGSLAVSRPWWWRRWWIGGTYASTSSSAVDGPSAAALGDGDAGAAARHQANGDPAPGGSAREGNPIDATAGTHLLRERDAVGPKRYALVTTVLALVLYNVHLYFSQ